MTQEQRDLLLQDLSARLPYGVMLNIIGTHGDEYEDDKLREVTPYDNGVLLINSICVYDNGYGMADIKPYLRPLSDMTKEEFEATDTLTKEQYGDWLNAHHFDYRNLIEQGLAVKAPEDMYNIK